MSLYSNAISFLSDDFVRDQPSDFEVVLAVIDYYFYFAYRFASKWFVYAPITSATLNYISRTIVIKFWNSLP